MWAEGYRLCQPSVPKECWPMRPELQSFSREARVWIFNFFFKILFIYSWETEREAKTQAEGKAGSPMTSLMWDLIPGPQGHALSRRQTLNHWATQASPDLDFYLFIYLFFIFSDLDFLKKLPRFSVTDFQIFFKNMRGTNRNPKQIREPMKTCPHIKLLLPTRPEPNPPPPPAAGSPPVTPPPSLKMCLVLGVF